MTKRKRIIQAQLYQNPKRPCQKRKKSTHISSEATYENGSLEKRRDKTTNLTDIIICNRKEIQTMVF